ncbi:MAG: translocation/assembly module TamB domain-containing protein [Thiomicrospira sp.]|jgi:translocation and assembly module TamB|nr:translocation/assembly module TamB domain-containing protein [Thiomicrospira sp.]
MGRWLYKTFTWLSLSSLILLSLIIWSALFATLYLATNPHIHNTLWPYVAQWTDNQVRIGHSEGQIGQQLRLHQLQLRFEGFSLDVDQIEYHWQPLALLKGQLHFKKLAIIGAELQLTATESSATPPNTAPFAPLIEWQTLINLRIDQLIARDIRLRQAEQHHQLNALNAAFRWHRTHLQLTQFDLHYAPYRLSTQGELHLLDAAHFKGQLHNQIQGLSAPFEQLEFNLDWRGSLQAQQLNLALIQPYQFTSQHQLQQDDNQAWLIQSDWQNLIAPLTAQHSLRLENLHTHLQISPDLALNADITLHQLTLDDLHIHTQHSQINSDNGLNLIRFNSQTQFAQQATLNLQGQFDRPHNQLQLDADLQQLDLSQFNPALKATLDSAFQLNWHTTHSVPHLVLTLDNLRLSTTNNPPLEISAIVHHHQNDDHHIELSAGRIRQAQRQGEFALNTRLASDFQSGHIQHAEIRLGDNLLHASGDWGEHTQLQIKGHLAKLEQLAQGLQGAINLSLDTRGNLKQQTLTSALKLDIEHLHYQQLQLRQGQFRADFNPFQPLYAQWALHLNQLQQADTLWIERLDWTRKKQPQHWQNQLQIQHPQLQLKAHFDEQHPTRQSANIRFNQLTIASKHSGNWALNQPWQLAWLGHDHFNAKQACLTQAHSEAAFCWQLPAKQQAQWQLRHAPVFDWLRPLLPPQLNLQGQLSAQGQANWQQAWSIEQRLYSEQIDLTYQLNGYPLPLAIHTFDTRLHITPSQAHFTSQAKLNQSGTWQLKGELHNQQAWSNAALKADLSLVLNEWPVDDSLHSLITFTHNHLQVNSQLSGRLDQLDHTTQAAVELHFDLPIIGLTQQQLQLQADIDSQRIQGQGLWQQPTNKQARFELQLDQLLTQPRLWARLNSQDLNLLNTPFAHIHAAPNLQFDWQNQAWQLSGQVDIQNSDINLEAMPSPQQQTTISQDGIVYDAQNRIIQGDTPFNGHIDIRLGFKPNVTINLRDAQVELGGEMQLQRLTQARQLSVFGELQLVRGHLLLDRQNRIEIDLSNIMFNGVAANPTLDVNLSRRVESTQARLNISGTATQPNFTFYSTPPLSQARVINLFIFGRAVDADTEPNYQSQVISALYKLGLQNNTPGLSQLTQTLGIQDVYFDIRDQQNANLILGRALTDDLYIRYVMGLGNQQNDAIEMIFKLSPRWSIESRNSDDASAGDIIFRQER